MAGGNLLSIGKAILRNKQLSDVVIKLIAGVVDSECSVLCRRNNASLFRKTSVTTMSIFQWSKLVDELSLNAPTLLHFLSTIVTHSDHRNKLKVASAHDLGLCMTVAVLLKERNREMCGVQSIVSILLYQSHVEKQVCITVFIAILVLLALSMYSGLLSLESSWALCKLPSNSRVTR